ncbi:MAG TPA: hypothetical protein PKX93_10060 [bacterium]|nr:hypothetical protein [bacterium]HOL67786.1 hypothetical protein [bacterium]HPP12762.1 hypothetical protein [bacterium]
MLVWVILIFVMGLFLSLADTFVREQDLVRLSGVVISLISLGIIVRMLYLSRRGEKEKLLKKIKELEGIQPGSAETAGKTEYR